MDLDDDPLDDLLRDSSANKFKKTEANVVPDDLLPKPQSLRKEKKSALLAELFGPSSTTSFSALETSSEDHDRFAERAGSISNLSTTLPIEEKKTEEFKFGNFVPSAVKSPLAPKSRPASSGSFNQQASDVPQPSAFSFEKITSERKNFTSDHVLTQELPRQSLFNMEPTNTTNLAAHVPPPLPIHQYPETGGYNSNNQNQYLPTTTPANPSIFASPQQATPKIVNNNVIAPQPPAGTIPFTFQLPNNSGSKEMPSDTNLSVIKEILENFSSNFCNRLETLTQKKEGLNDIAGCLVELHKCINTASQNWLTTVSASSDRTGMAGEYEKRILILETKIESMSQENLNLRSRLEFVESQLRDTRSDTSRIKQDTETAIGSNLKWVKEAVSNLENRISSHSSNQAKQADEEANNLWRQTNERIADLESKLVKNSTSEQKEETLRLLKGEIKWLERQKGKLSNDRKELQALQKKNQGKLQLLEGLSSVRIKYSSRRSQLLIITNFRNFHALLISYSLKV